MLKSKHILGLFLSTLLIVILIGSCKSPVSEKIPTYHIVGTVTDKTNGSPIEDALIELEFMTNRLLASTKTDKNGYYSLKYHDKPPNPPLVDVRASANAYSSQFKNIQPTTDTQTINFELSPKT
jgi:hypothetical protein